VATSALYTLALRSLVSGDFAWEAGLFKVLLLDSTYVPNQDTHRYYSDLTGQVVGEGYIAGGAEVLGRSLAVDPVTNKITLRCFSPEFPVMTVTPRYAVFYNDTGTQGGSALLCWWDFGANVVVTADTLTLTIDVAGLVTATTP